MINKLPLGKVYVSCSGGVDSVAGTVFLNKTLDRDLEIVHINNRLGSFDDESADRVVALGKWLGCKVHVHVEEVEDFHSLEHQCRNTRIKAFDKYSSPVILCHHLNDCVESYLMKCFKGIVGNGYQPIPIYGVKTIRPFLLTLKNDFIRYAKKHSLMHFIEEDPLNEKSTRGWLRNKAIPVIGEKYPGLETILRKMYLRFYQDDEELEKEYVWKKKIKSQI